jgi:hypothetical protein
MIALTCCECTFALRVAEFGSCELDMPLTPLLAQFSTVFSMIMLRFCSPTIVMHSAVHYARGAYWSLLPYAHSVHLHYCKVLITPKKSDFRSFFISMYITGCGERLTKTLSFVLMEARAIEYMVRLDNCMCGICPCRKPIFREVWYSGQTMASIRCDRQEEPTSLVCIAMPV